jgi:hypothetical protein
MPLITRVFSKFKKRIIRVIASSGRLVSCHGLFKKLQILPLQSQYIFSLLLFVAKKRNCFISSTDTQDIDTRYNYNLYLTNKLCGAEYHSRCHKLCSHSVVSQHFMEPEGSLLSLQELSTCTYPEPNQSRPQHSILSLKGPS